VSQGSVEDCQEREVGRLTFLDDVFCAMKPKMETDSETNCAYMVASILGMDHNSERAAGQILVVDDDAELCKLVSRYLGAEGYSVDTVQTSTLGIERTLAGGYDLVVLDVMLPDIDGFEVLRRIRATLSTPVLMLTARGDDLDRILGLEIGADDYLSKPFNTRELSARVRAILRRVSRTRGNRTAADVASIRIGDLELNPGSRTVRCKGEALNLTTVEFDLLQRLLRSAGAVVGREELTKDVLGREFSPYDRSIDTHVWSLRKKVGNSDDGAERIKGIRGVGYQYALADPGSNS
jgi:DNA-binding response OmpR family regulator